MECKVVFATPLLRATNGKKQIISNATTIKELVLELCEKFENFRKIALSESGEIKKVLNVYLDEYDVQDLQGLHTVIEDGQEVNFIPTIAGG